MADMGLRARITRITEIVAGATVGPITRILAPDDATPGHLVAVDAAGQPVVLVPPPDAPEVLDDLTDVDAAGPNDGDVLTYSGSAGAWIAGDVPAPGSAPPRIAVSFQWAGDATAGDDEGVRAVHVPDYLAVTSWKIEAVDAAGELESASAEFAVSARPAAGGSLVSLVGSGTAPKLTSAPQAADDADDWDGGIIEQHGTLVVQPLSHSPGDSRLLTLTLFCERTTPPVDPYSYAVFTSSGDFEVPEGVTEVDVLLVAGGGGGGSRQGGGGGAGGVREVLAVSVTPEDTITVTVGAGGAGGTSGARGTNGSDSSFGAESATGGGGGGGRTTNNAGAAGGSGGGGANSAGGGAGTSGQGNAGGAGSVGTNVGGGGGGASAAGTAGTGINATGVGGNGGDGVTLATLGWGGAVGLGAPAAVGGGGGGGVAEGQTGAIAGQGGLGGGGTGADGGSQAAGSDGLVNTGGGGGGSNIATFAGGAGGSGLVVVRWVAP